MNHNTSCSPLARRALVTLVASGLAAASLAACSGSGGGDGSTSPSAAAPATSGATLAIGVATDEPGISVKEGSSYSGFDIDTAKYVAGKLGVGESNIVWKPVAKADRESALASGEVDLVVQSYSITDARKQKVDFAGPYFEAKQDLLIRRNDETISSPETLDGKTLCSVKGTTSAAFVKQRYAGKITLREVPSLSECVRSLAAGDVDAVTDDDLILAGFAATPEYKGVLRVLGKGFSDETYGIGVKKGDSAMVGKVNSALKEYISSGAWKKSLNETVAPSGYSVPAAPTVG
ncbi:glutamate ABC transporter substrate-binding protein [Arsenicicoccus piscis]|uniref:ABC transporter substrate-binding protein n=1 Tax=Arsenicicoccus piscis TaxID=673954 RepID=A0ABQ6HNE4_9MICO|nr:glutamate ABC transporter substrate-binding protein [Arsenicicoccus piscis]MCH8629048.1 glutamate ABC transporter substrate-binding protein [Arsenicicoccus piscis]GMA19672.1 ABC transporter substrate-binding protein [Arsenicicoccus piscis]